MNVAQKSLLAAGGAAVLGFWLAYTQAKKKIRSKCKQQVRTECGKFLGDEFCAEQAEVICDV